MALLHPSQLSLLGPEIRDIYRIQEINTEVAEASRPFDALQHNVEGLQLDKVGAFLGAVGVDLAAQRYVVTDTGTLEAQHILISNGVLDFSCPGEHAAGVTIQPYVSIIDRRDTDTARDTEGTIVHELVHQGSQVPVQEPDPGEAQNGAGVTFGAAGLARRPTGGEEQNFWEESKAQTFAAGYDRLTYGAQPGDIIRVEGTPLAVPARYVRHNARPGYTVASGVAAAGLELLIHKDPAIVDYLTLSVSRHEYVGMLKYRIDRLAPHGSDLFNQINSTAPNIAGYTQGVNTIVDTVYAGQSLPAPEQIGEQSTAHLDHLVRMHTGTGLKAKAFRWLRKYFV